MRTPGYNDIEDEFNAIMTKHGIKYGSHMGFVNRGWFKIIDQLCTDMIANGWDKDLHQVKEKFGGLRFYVGGANEVCHGLTDAAEGESLKTCEECGKPGHPHGRGWIRTTCEMCDALHNVVEG
jgi:hypothetical protein